MPAALYRVLAEVGGAELCRSGAGPGKGPTTIRGSRLNIAPGCCRSSAGSWVVCRIGNRGPDMLPVAVRGSLVAEAQSGQLAFHLGATLGARSRLVRHRDGARHAIGVWMAVPPRRPVADPGWWRS